MRNALLDTEKKFGDALKAAGKDKGTGDNGEVKLFVRLLTNTTF